jgi:hypothetical protein
VPREAPESGCNWPSFYSLNIPIDWTTGLYRADLTDSSNHTNSLHFIVKENNPGSLSPILFQFPSTTYQAYNGWGEGVYIPLTGQDEPEESHLIVQGTIFMTWKHLSLNGLI